MDFSKASIASSYFLRCRSNDPKLLYYFTSLYNADRTEEAFSFLEEYLPVDPENQELFNLLKESGGSPQGKQPILRGSSFVGVLVGMRSEGL